jgi:5-methylcytosine-specific restriction endonuclease McrA
LHGRVLLLNGSSWEPLAIISVMRAINLIIAGKAVVIEDTGKFLRTVSTTFPIPSVIALRRYINVPRRRAHWSRKGVLARDSYTCIYCGVRPGDISRGKPLTKTDFTVDHILPRSRGGKDNWTNTACACYGCNHRKGDRLPGEAGMKLTWEPKIPRTSYLVIAVGSGPDAWRSYIEVAGGREDSKYIDSKYTDSKYSDSKYSEGKYSESKYSDNKYTGYADSRFDGRLSDGKDSYSQQGEQ